MANPGGAIAPPSPPLAPPLVYIKCFLCLCQGSSDITCNHVSVTLTGKNLNRSAHLVSTSHLDNVCHRLATLGCTTSGVNVYYIFTFMYSFTLGDFTYKSKQKG